MKILIFFFQYQDKLKTRKDVEDLKDTIDQLT